MRLREIRRRIERLADGGRFRVACARTGEEPVPAAGLSFPDRETAAVAAVLTRVYRSRLRRWDASTPWFDPVVHERGRAAPAAAESGRHAVEPAMRGEP